MAIRTQILLCMLLVVGVYTVAGALVVHFSVREHVLRSTEEILIDRVAVTAADLDGTLDELASVTARSARAVELAPFLRGERDSVEAAGEALALIERHTRADTLFLLDVDGGIALQTGEAMQVPGAVVEHPTIRGALERGVGAWWLTLEGYPYQTALAPVNVGDDRVGLLLSVDAFDLETLEALRNTSGADVVLLHGNGALLHTLGTRVGDDAVAAESFALLARHSPGERHPHQMALFGERFVVIEAPLGTRGQGDELGIALLTPVETITAMARAVRNQLGAVGVLATALAVLLAVVLGRNITRPLEDLVAYTRRAAEGDPAPASSSSPLPEMVVLAGALSDLVRQQKRRRTRAEERARQTREQEIGRALQAHLEMGDVETPGFDTAVGAWRLDEAAGDVVELMPADDGGLWIALGGVVARGVTASAIGALLRGAVAAAVEMFPGEPPTRVLGAVNRALTERIRRAGWEPAFVGLRLMHLSPGGRLVFAGAQQEMLLLSAGEGAVRHLTWHGTWLGLGPGAIPDDPDGVDSLDPGDTLVMQTDGLLSGQDDAGRMFGHERVRQVLEQSQGHPARVVRDRLMSTWEQWTETHLDDATVVVIRRRSGGGSAANA